MIAAEPDETDPTGVRQIVRVAAASIGEFHDLAQPYGPLTQGDPTSYIVLSEPVGAAIAASTLPLFLRVWQAQLPVTIGAPVTLYDPNTQISTGLEVTLSGANVLADGAYWQIAVRPSTPQAVYPEDLLTAPRAADGPLRLVCPLAVIDWTAAGGAEHHRLPEHLRQPRRSHPAPTGLLHRCDLAAGPDGDDQPADPDQPRGDDRRARHGMSGGRGLYADGSAAARPCPCRDHH